MADDLKSPDRVILLLTLVPYLREHGPTSITTLSDHFGVDASTVRKLARFLGTAGVPGETLTYQPDDLFDIDWTALEERDTLDLISTVAVDEAPRFSGAETAALQAGLHELSKILPSELASVALQTAAKLTSARSTTDHPVTVSSDPVSEKLERVSDALQRKKAVSFSYRNRDGDVSSRTVDPLLLLQRHGEWYLQAHCHTSDAERVFRIDGLSELKVDEHLSHTRGHDVSAPVVMRSPEWTSLTAEFHVRNEVLYLTEGWEPVVTNSNEEGWSRVVVTLEHEYRAVDFIALAPGAIIALNPISVRDAVRTWGEQMLDIDAAARKSERPAIG